MKEFFGFGTGEYEFGRPADGAYSWQHLLMVSIFVVLGVALAIFLGIKNKNKDYDKKNKVLIIAAILIDSFELFTLLHSPITFASSSFKSSGCSRR